MSQTLASFATWPRPLKRDLELFSRKNYSTRSVFQKENTQEFLPPPSWDNAGG
jgi:hypothetical protein